MKALLLCAGEGKRLRPWTALRPKPLMPFLGLPLVSFPLEQLRNLGVGDLVVNVHHLADQLEVFFSRHASRWSSVQISDERSLLLDSGGAVLKARTHLESDDDFIYFNGDELFFLKDPTSLQKMIAHHKNSKNLATLLTCLHPEVGHTLGGAWTHNGSQQIVKFSKTVEVPLKGHHFLGFMVLSKRIFEFLPDSPVPLNILYTTLTAALKDNEKIEVFDTQADWYEVGTLSSYISTSRVMASKILQESNRKTKPLTQLWESLYSTYQKDVSDICFQDESVKENQELIELQQKIRDYLLVK